MSEVLLFFFLGALWLQLAVSTFGDCLPVWLTGCCRGCLLSYAMSVCGLCVWPRYLQPKTPFWLSAHGAILAVSSISHGLLTSYVGQWWHLCPCGQLFISDDERILTAESNPLGTSCSAAVRAHNSVPNITVEYTLILM